MTKEQDKVKKARGIYLLPNLFTVTALFAGFYAVVAAMKGRFDQAAIAIFIAMIMDGLDGRIARLTNTATAFGAEFDSLSDMVSFGVAPALVVYSWALSGVGKIGWLAAFLFAACGALRLARFNVQAAHSKRYFSGLPIPAGAGFIAAMVWFGNELLVTKTHGFDLAVAIITVIVALLMVSNIRYRSFKDIDMKGKVPFIVIPLVVLLFVLISLDPPKVLFFGYGIYLISGPIAIIWWSIKAKRLRRHRRRKK